MTRQTIVAAALVHISLASCNQTGCRNTNQVFEQHTPDSKEYRHELAKELNANSDTATTYTFKGYIENNDKTYLIVGISGDSICAEGYMEVTDWSGPIQEIQRTKGTGYNGAELEGLEYSVNEDGTLIYKKLESIID